MALKFCEILVTQGSVTVKVKGVDLEFTAVLGSGKLAYISSK